MLASQWIADVHSKPMSTAELASILPELAAILKFELKVAEVRITVGIQTVDEFDEIEILMLVGEAA